MADETPDERSSVLPKPLRTVTPLSRPHRDESMDFIGIGIFAGLLLLLVPVLPFIVIAWLISKVVDALTGE